jgi:hypothetical protein
MKITYKNNGKEAQEAQWIFNDIETIKRHFYCDTYYLVVNYKNGTTETVYSLPDLEYLAKKTDYKLFVSGLVRESLFEIWEFSQKNNKIAGCKVERQPTGSYFKQTETVFKIFNQKQA